MLFGFLKVAVNVFLYMTSRWRHLVCTLFMKPFKFSCTLDLKFKSAGDRLQLTPLNLPSTGAALYFPSGPRHRLLHTTNPPPHHTNTHTRSVWPVDHEGLTPRFTHTRLQEGSLMALPPDAEQKEPPPQDQEGLGDIYCWQTLTVAVWIKRLLHVDTYWLTYHQHQYSCSAVTQVCFPGHYINEVGFTVPM